MVGGNIPDKTRVVSVANLNHVEALEYSRSPLLAGHTCCWCFRLAYFWCSTQCWKTQPVAIN